MTVFQLSHPHLSVTSRSIYLDLEGSILMGRHCYSHAHPGHPVSNPARMRHPSMDLDIFPYTQYVIPYPFACARITHTASVRVPMATLDPFISTHYTYVPLHVTYRTSLDPYALCPSIPFNMSLPLSHLFSYAPTISTYYHLLIKGPLGYSSVYRVSDRPKGTNPRPI